jgi:3-hydroxy-3-methylglutaryl CoA synthase
MTSSVDSGVGIIAASGYLPYYRLDRSTIAAIAGGGGGKGSRSVASFDEDATTLAVGASRALLKNLTARPSALWFSTTAPAYLDRTNAGAIHAALRLDRSAGAYDALGSVRSTMGALRSALSSKNASMVAAGDIRIGLPGSPDETNMGDAGAALLTGTAADGEVIATPLAWVSTSEEMVDRWRTPGDMRSKVWEERFGEMRYSAIGVETFERLLHDAGISADQVDHLIVTGTHQRGVKGVIAKSKVKPECVVDDLSATIGMSGAAHPLLLLASALERAKPGEVIVLLVLADGADGVVFRTTDALANYAPSAPVAEQLGSGGMVTYGKYLSWRGILPIEPPRRPEPARPSSPASNRSNTWKFGFVGNRDAEGEIHLPPSPLGGTQMPMADEVGTVTTFTIDRLSYSPSPPLVFAVVDFEGGGRLPIELTDVEASQVAIGMKVEMTFRRLFSADGIQNYFWKARPVRGGAN